MPLDTINNGEAASSVRSKLNTAIGQVNTNTTDITGKQPLDTDLTTIAGLTPSNDDVLQRKTGAWTNRSMAQLKTDLAIGISDVSSLQATLDTKQDEGAVDTTIWRIARRTGDVTPVITDNKTAFIINNSGATVFNIPLDASVAFAQGTEIRIINKSTSTNNVTVTPAGGVTVTFVNGASLAMAPQTGAHLLKIDTDEWILQY